MKIALVAPPYLPVPPAGYGGTEKIVSLLCEGLVKRGHEVTLFASGDSQTRARLISIFSKSLGNSGFDKNDALAPFLHYREVLKHQDEFDLIHSHAQYLGLFAFAQTKIPVVHTWHGSYCPGEVPESKRLVLESFPNAPIVSISNNQRAGMPGLNYIATVYNGVNLGDYPFVENPRGDYLLWVGRIVEKKGPLTAIQVAKSVGLPLQMAAAIDPIDQDYFDSSIKPHIDGNNVIFHGELSHRELVDLYGNARATLYPITWHEPFGLVVIESMACGTPVVAYDMGSMPEIIEHAKTGFIIPVSTGIDGLTQGIRTLDKLKRLDCRRRVETHFSADTMVDAYVNVYEKILSH